MKTQYAYAAFNELHCQLSRCIFLATGNSVIQPFLNIPSTFSENNLDELTTRFHTNTQYNVQANLLNPPMPREGVVATLHPESFYW